MLQYILQPLLTMNQSFVEPMWIIAIKVGLSLWSPFTIHSQQNQMTATQSKSKLTGYRARTPAAEQSPCLLIELIFSRLQMVIVIKTLGICYVPAHFEGLKIIQYMPFVFDKRNVLPEQDCRIDEFESTIDADGEVVFEEREVVVTD